MDEEKINLITAGVLDFIGRSTNSYKLVAADWVVLLSDLYVMPSWELNEQKCVPTLCLIQLISDNHDVNREVILRIRRAFLNQKYFNIESTPDESTRNQLLKEKAQKTQEIEALVKEMSGKFLLCYYNHSNFMDGYMPSYDYLPL